MYTVKFPKGHRLLINTLCSVLLLMYCTVASVSSVSDSDHMFYDLSGFLATLLVSASVYYHWRALQSEGLNVFLNYEEKSNIKRNFTPFWFLVGSYSLAAYPMVDPSTLVEIESDETLSRSPSSAVKAIGE
jgi:hypothetical protein